MKGWVGPKRKFVRPTVVAAVFILPGEAMVWLFRGPHLQTDGDLTAEIVLSLAVGPAMAIAIGLMVGFTVGERHHGLVAGTIASLCYATVTVATILLGFELDTEFDLFRVTENPALFFATVVMPFLVSTPLYGWLLHSRIGDCILSRLRL